MRIDRNKLSNLNALIFDCQATGARPTRDFLIEMGWAKISGLSDISEKKIHSYLINDTLGRKIPKQVSRVTGIQQYDLDSGHEKKKVWKKFIKQVKEVSQSNSSDMCLLIIHFARFEEPYLKDMYENFGSSKNLPFKIICTHKIVKRLLPELPRLGLRAVAGYFDYPVTNLRRSFSHVKATAYIWSKVVPILEKNNICTLDDLFNWLAKPAIVQRGKRIYPMNKEVLKELPDSPGIYKMLRSNKDIIYIGKATSIKQRVKSYFQKQKGHAEHTLEMLSQAKDLSFMRTNSALEAALLESDEIKNNSPPYNKSLINGNKRIYFFNRELEQSSMKRTEKFRIGPVSSQDLLTALYLIGILFIDESRNKQIEESISGVLALPEEFAPDPLCFQEGFELFTKKYSSNFASKFVHHKLISIGTQSWKEKIEEEKEIGEEEEEKEKEFIWTPDGVLKSIESVLRRCAHQLRRAKWFCILSESSITWRVKEKDLNKKNLLIFQNGVLKKCEIINLIDNIPVPPGYRKRLKSRQKNFDLSTYDRMRVLTTEMRRLVKEERDIEIKLGQKSSLNNNKIKRLLLWL